MEWRKGSLMRFFAFSSSVEGCLYLPNLPKPDHYSALNEGMRPYLVQLFYLCGLLSSFSVTNYSTKAAVLTLKHNHPPGNSVKALVDVNLLLNTLQSHETRVGEWVNVMGYIEQAKNQNSLSIEDGEVRVQALVLWSSGPFNLQSYEKSLDSRVSESTSVEDG